MRAALAVSLALMAWAPVRAGELIFTNGSRMAGELSNEALLVSTGAGLVEIAPDEVVALSHGEVRLRDGRVIRGTLVGGQVKARTSLGEIAVKVDELRSYRTTGGPGGGAAPAAASQTAASPGTSPVSAPSSAAPGRSDTGIVGGLPTVKAYQDPQSNRQGNGPSATGVQTAAVPAESPSGRMYEVVGESVLYRDALFSSARVGRVVAGQQVRYVDSIDRRLRILNLLVFDGGHWVKVRLSDGIEGWVPADTVREVR
jgi:hypothetical protein